jgi:hypothetical protein
MVRHPSFKKVRVVVNGGPSANMANAAKEVASPCPLPFALLRKNYIVIDGGREVGRIYEETESRPELR